MGRRRESGRTAGLVRPDLTTEYLVHREMEHVFAALMPANRLVCRVCVSTGLRVGDVVALRTEQLAPQFWVTEAKTKKRRRVNLTKELLASLRAVAGPVWVFTSPRCPDICTGPVKPSGGTLNGLLGPFGYRRTLGHTVCARSMPWTSSPGAGGTWRRSRGP